MKREENSDQIQSQYVSIKINEAFYSSCLSVYILIPYWGICYTTT